MTGTATGLGSGWQLAEPVKIYFYCGAGRRRVCLHGLPLAGTDGRPRARATCSCSPGNGIGTYLRISCSDRLPSRPGCMPATQADATVGAMTAQPGGDPPYEVIHLGGEAAAIVPLGELRRLQAVERHASPEALEEAEIEATLAAHDEWVAAGCPGALTHEEVVAQLLRPGQ